METKDLAKQTFASGIRAKVMRRGKQLPAQTQTDPRYWDCECKTRFRHLKAKVKTCKRCGTSHRNQPDSMSDELAPAQRKVRHSRPWSKHSKAEYVAFRVVVFKYLVQRVEYYIEAPNEKTARDVAYYGVTEERERRIVAFEGLPEPQDPIDTVVDEVRKIPRAGRTVRISSVDSPQYTWECPVCGAINDVSKHTALSGDKLRCFECEQEFTYNGETN